MRRWFLPAVLVAILAAGLAVERPRAGLDVALPPPLGRAIYTSSTTDAVVTGANVRSSMLPVDVRSGVAYVTVPANALPVGSHLYLVGSGTIGARLTTPPGFNFVPWVQPAGGGKTDLPGFAAAPLLGTDGTCEVWLKITQTPTGIRTSGFVRYGATNGQAYSIPVNGGGTGASGVLPSVVASDPGVERTFGVDGFWGAGANAREDVKARSVTVTHFPPM